MAEDLGTTVEEVAAALEEQFSNLYALVEGKDFKGSIGATHLSASSVEIKKNRILLGCRSDGLALRFPCKGIRRYSKHGDGRYLLRFYQKRNKEPKLILGEWDWSVFGDEHTHEYDVRKFLRKYLKKKGPEVAFGLAKECMKLPKLVLAEVEQKTARKEKAVREITGELEALSREFRASVDYLNLYCHHDGKFKSTFQKMCDGERVVVLRHVLKSKLRNLELDEWLEQNHAKLVETAGLDNFIGEV